MRVAQLPVVQVAHLYRGPAVEPSTGLVLDSRDGVCKGPDLSGRDALLLSHSKSLSSVEEEVGPMLHERLYQSLLHYD